METTAADPAPALLDLRRRGRLAAEYPAVRALLAEADTSRTAHAGRILAGLDPAEVLAAHPGTPALTVAVLGHGTVGPLVAPLTGELARHGLLLRPYVGSFDSWVFELSDPGSPLYAADPDLTLCLLDPAVVFDEVPLPWRPEDAARVLDGKVELIAGLAARFAATARGVLVLNTLPLPRRWTHQLVDHQSRARLGALWREANARLLRLGEENAAVVVVDLDPLLAEGVPVTDPRLDAYAKAHLSEPLLAAYAREAGHLARHLAGLTRKVLVLDLDQTVWGGILGDDGPEGVEAGGTPRGEAFRGFQRVVKQLGSQGVLLAAVSKNDREPVLSVLRDHPEMTLREPDFVRVTADWRPKPAGLTDLAEALNLGTSGFVFVDDSPFERGLVRRELPEVAVVAVDEEPALHVERLLSDGWFDVRRLTGEDRRRTELYRGEVARSDFLQGFDSLADYLNELDVTVRLRPLAAEELPRVSQLTLRTNQFNLTTRRLQPAEVAAFAAAEGTGVLTVRSADRFGDNGLVGAVFLAREGGALRIDNFLLSCRVFSRGIEQAVLSAVLGLAAGGGLREVTGHYRPSPRNGTVKDLLPRYGFVPADGPAPPDGSLAFRHDLGTELPPPGHLRLDAELAGLLEGHPV
ncbi:HAD-IIIC family phosphatase [Streptomyces sp. NRRL WC-3742]|uniref:HAD-IIIC family phosphatase n=1 Tax=Streptomyces sp. NRRL WC-3742 TaxID=1463934 RepID=UPI00068B1BF4|nr:HAD-IIIC family phosphatase [Streptomyces sp. NRRL WC-3742]